MSVRCSLLWPVGALLGEGPIWCPEDGALRFVDIKGGAVHRYVPATGERQSTNLPGQPSFIVPTEHGTFLIGSDCALHAFDGDALGAPFAAIEMPDHNRTNDATVDCHGRLWFGTMDDAEERTTGAIYCLERGVLHRMDAEAVVTNGPAVTADGSILYHVNSPDRSIWRSHVLDGPRLDAPELFVRLREDEGYPDGIVLDSEGTLWVALWDGWGVRRYAPDGTLLLHVDLPCARVTKIAFGGDDLRTAFVTTARIGLTDEQSAAQPMAGGLFSFRAPAAGHHLPAVRLHP